ncbi:cytochrome P450 [Tanacetum coccineum]
MATFTEMFPSPQTCFVYVLVFITFVFLIVSKWISYHSKTKRNLPPSPPKLPIIGNFHQLGLTPHRSLQKLSEKYGPLILLHLGSVPTLVASSAEAAREIMKTSDTSFCNQPTLNIPTILFYGCKDIAFASYGENWKQLKSIVVLHILSNARVKSFRSVREEELGCTISAIEDNYGYLVDLSALFASYTNNIFCRVALGRTYNGLDRVGPELFATLGETIKK